MATIQQIREARTNADQKFDALVKHLEEQDKLNQAADSASEAAIAAGDVYQQASNAAAAYAPQVIAAENEAIAAYKTVAALLEEEGLPEA